MNRMTALGLMIPALLLAPERAPAQQAGPANMSFFVASANPGQGANLGGLAGADAYCQRLAQAAGATARNWRAYLSTQGDGAVNARDRIGRGPWRNARGEVIATDVQQLHGQNNLSLQTALDERGQPVNGRRQQPNNHDILTGTQADGTAFAAGEDRTCRNWTSGGEGAAMVGHHDREGLRDDDASRSWNASHASRGCGLEALRTTGGAGLFYCFAAD